MTENAIKLLVVDDSRIMRDAMAEMFADDSGIEIVGEAVTGIDALEGIRQYRPDVITLDVAMPEMDGITALKHIMIQSPRPTLMLSSLTLEGARVAFDALRYGAVDFIAKPSNLNETSLAGQQAEIRSKIKYAAGVEVEAIKYIRSRQMTGSATQPAHQPGHKLVVFGAAEGGYGSLLKIIPHLSPDLPVSYLVTLYAAPAHVAAFASYLDNISTVHVRQAMHEDIIRSGICYLNSGADYMTVHKQGDAYILHVSPAPFASRKGAIDMLFFSAAELLGKDCTGVVLSGLDADGAEGLEEVVHRHGAGLIQDPKTCFCKGMVSAAMARCKSAPIIPDADIAAQIGRLTDVDTDRDENPVQKAGLR